MHALNRIVNMNSITLVWKINWNNFSKDTYQLVMFYERTIWKDLFQIKIFQCWWCVKKWIRILIFFMSEIIERRNDICNKWRRDWENVREKNEIFFINLYFPSILTYLHRRKMEKYTLNIYWKNLLQLVPYIIQ